MFHRLHLEDWCSIFPIIVFMISFGAFLGGVVYVVRMKKHETERSSHLPLEQEQLKSTDR